MKNHDRIQYVKDVYTMIMESNLYINENEVEITGACRRDGAFALMIGEYVCDVGVDKSTKNIHARVNLIMDRKTAQQVINTLEKMIEHGE